LQCIAHASLQCLFKKYDLASPDKRVFAAIAIPKKPVDLQKIFDESHGHISIAEQANGVMMNTEKITAGQNQRGWPSLMYRSSSMCGFMLRRQSL
jgi:hypothetical protein